MIDFEAFSDEYGAIKEASVGSFINTGMKGFRAVGQGMRTGYRAGVAAATKANPDAGALAKGWGGIKGTVGTTAKKLWGWTGSELGRKRLGSMATIAGGTGLAGYGAYQGGKKLLGGGRSAAPTYVTNYGR